MNTVSENAPAAPNEKEVGDWKDYTELKEGPHSSGAVSKHIILQLAVRAVRKVHFETQLLSLGQFDDAADPDLVKRINTGVGIEVAPETTVRDALAQEFNTSKLGHGWKLRGAGDTWFGVIDREVAYQVHGDERPSLVDIEYRRVRDRNDKTKDGKVYPLGPLELKRAKWFKPDLVTGEPDASRSQMLEVKSDLRKLVRFARASRISDRLALPSLEGLDEYDRKLHPHILVWGIQNDPDDAVREHSPDRFMNAAFDAVKGCGCKERNRFTEWFPIRWARDAAPRVTRWAWITLAEIDIGGAECADLNCECHLERPPAAGQAPAAAVDAE